MCTQLINWSEKDYGGHFIALEVPDDVVDDLRDCFKQLLKL